MVLPKRLDYGSRGYQVPAMPHIPRSARGKRSNRRKSNQMCAFDLLATVAGTLLTDQENFSNLPDINGSPNHVIARNLVKQEQFGEASPFKNVALEKDSCNSCTLESDGVFPRHANLYLAEHSSTRHDTDSGLKLLAAKPIVSGKDSLTSCTKSGEFGSSLGTIPEDGAARICSPGSAKPAEAKEVVQAGPQMIKSEIDGDAPAMYSLVDSMDLDAKPPTLVSSDSSSELPLYSHDTPRRNSSPMCQEGMQLAAERDDDENSSGCTHPSTTGNKAFRPHHVGDSRRKLFASKLRKAARSRIHGELPKTEIKLGFHGKKMSPIRQRTQRTTFQRKKLVENHSRSARDRGIFSEASGTSFSMEGQKPPYGSEDYHVKLSIKSFKVPELFIEIPENATVGSLKRSVMDAVTAIIEGGLRVGVLLQGKNVRDDNKTLRQAGICHGERLDNVGFTLESEAEQDPRQIMVTEDRNFLDADIMEPLARIQSEEPFPVNGASDTNPQPIPTTPSNCPTSGHDSALSPIEAMAQENSSANSRALVPVQPIDVEALAIVPLHKSKRSDIGQRRIRRPFSVAEVEALVQAVEKLGTGRWRDVKHRAFDNAKHRTYVDLKDKWKTLVHTASISPQQRRGEPVPQELLDRVLSAQAYWSQQQAKLPVAEACLA